MECSSGDEGNRVKEDEDFDLEASVHLLSKPLRWKYFRREQEVIELDDIPPVIKSANGNIFWADEQCTRRVGLTCTEARLFLRLLQVDGPETFVYADYKTMFDDFGREQEMLKHLITDLPCWSWTTHKQKKIWKARIEWLDRMKEPRHWLLFLMARRRRILKKATVLCLARFREKSQQKATGTSRVQNSPVGGSMVVGETAQASTSQYDVPDMAACQSLARAKMVDGSGSENALAHRLTVPPSTVKGLRTGLVTGYRRSNFHLRSRGDSHIFDRQIQATRKDIKHQVELLMPQPRPYIVVGWFPRGASNPKEKILEFDSPECLFHMLKYGESNVRGWRRFLSLKSLKGFGVYQCDLSRGAHIPIILSTPQKAILSQFYLAYQAFQNHADDTVSIAWNGWVQKNLNGGNNKPLEGRYSLVLRYDWSSYRLTLAIAVPLLLSIAMGFCYMTVGDVVTAWTISLYIITAAVAVIALLAIIGILNDT